MFRIEAGATIHPSIDFVLAAIWCRAQTNNANISGTILTKFVEYTSLHAAGLFKIQIKRTKAELFARIQAGFLHGSSMYDEGSLTASLIPGLGVKLAPLPFAQLILEGNLFTASLSLDRNASSIHG